MSDEQEPTIWGIADGQDPKPFEWVPKEKAPPTLGEVLKALADIAERDRQTMSNEEKQLGEALIATHQQAQRIPWRRPMSEAPRDGRKVLLWWPYAVGGDYYVGRWTERDSIHGLACWVDDEGLRIGEDDCFSHFAELTEP